MFINLKIVEKSYKMLNFYEESVYFLFFILFFFSLQNYLIKTKYLIITPLLKFFLEVIFNKLLSNGKQKIHS